MVMQLQAASWEHLSELASYVYILEPCASKQEDLLAWLVSYTHSVNPETCPSGGPIHVQVGHPLQYCL